MTLYHRWIRDNTRMPWRLRHGFEQWLEEKAWRAYPRLYQWLHFGRFSDPVRPITSGPKHHFFGYYDKSPWNISGDRLLAHEASFNDRPPNAEDKVTIGLVNPGERSFHPLAESHAWNWQQGAMLQWFPGEKDLLLYNDRRNNRFVGLLRTTDGKEEHCFERPIYSVTPDGRHAYSLNFARLHTHRPGYGYAGLPDRWADEHHPSQDGIWRIELESGRSELIISLDQLAQLDPTPQMQGVPHWINHVQVSPGGTHFAFFHIWRVGEDGWRVRLYTASADGSDLDCLLDSEFVSHYDWLDNHRILIWAVVEGEGHFYLLDGKTGERQIIGNSVLTEDGHCSYSPDRHWVLNDTYPDPHGMRTLMLYRWPDGPRIDLARLYSPKERWWGEIRCDLHPRWSRDGHQICIDSVHNGERQMYIMDVSNITKTSQ